jgi:hypothetical protein
MSHWLIDCYVIGLMASHWLIVCYVIGLMVSLIDCCCYVILVVSRWLIFGVMLVWWWCVVDYYCGTGISPMVYYWLIVVMYYVPWIGCCCDGLVRLMVAYWSIFSLIDFCCDVSVGLRAGLLLNCCFGVRLILSHCLTVSEMLIWCCLITL